MRHLDDLRQALADETADLYLDLHPDLIRRRARRVRTRRTVLRATAVALVLAIAVPAAVLAHGAGRGDDVARPAPSCTPASAGAEWVSARSGPVTWLGAPSATGLTAGPEDNLHDMRVGLTGTVGRPSLLVEHVSRSTGAPTYPFEFVVARTPDGEILVEGATVGVKLINVELATRTAVFYLGLYAGTGHDITIDINGHETAAAAVANEPTGWTIFWAVRTPPPPVQDDIDAPGKRPAVLVRFNVYDDAGTRVLSQAAMPGVSGALLPDRPDDPTCPG